MVRDNVSLYYREGTSDKEYHVQLVRMPADLFVVNFQYGRRNSTLTEGSKTTTPVPYDQAKTIYDRLVREKKEKGYREGQNSTPYEGTENAGQQSGLLPQLLNFIDEATVFELIEDPGWIMQEKKDGRRLMLQSSAGGVKGSNRKGLIVAFPSPIAQAATALGVDFVLDGEAVDDIHFAFDAPAINGESLRNLGFVERHQCLSVFLQSGKPEAIQIVPLWATAQEKREEFHRLRSNRAEGVVFKRANAPYVSGRPNSGGDHLKFKFTADATCFVRRLNTKRSVALGVEGAGGKIVGVGNVTIPPNHDIPNEGELVKVRYLYAYRGGSLYQPVYLGSREGEGCLGADNITLLKYKRGREEDEA